MKSSIQLTTPSAQMKSSSAWGQLNKDRCFPKKRLSLLFLNLTVLPDFLEHFLALLVCFAFYPVELGQFDGRNTTKFQDLIFKYLAVVLDERQSKTWCVVADDNPAGLALQMAPESNFLIEQAKSSAKTQSIKPLRMAGIPLRRQGK